jgi:hypothetical protein
VTNYVVSVTSYTNTVIQTNTVPVTVTNVIGTITNVVVIEATEPVTNYTVTIITNITPQFFYSGLSSNGLAVQDTVTAIGNLAGGWGGLAGTIVGALAAIWGWVRSSAKSKTAGQLAQVIETAREIIKTVPNGAEYDAELVRWMMKHQAEAGTMTTVLSLLKNVVDNDSAKQVAGQLIGFIKAAQDSVSQPPTKP